MNRRSFIKGTAAGLAATSIAGTKAVANSAKELRVGLIGCGGRGTGAAIQALNADPDVVLYAMGDLTADRLASSHNGLVQNFGERVQADSTRQFVGFDAFEKVIAEVDIVLLATPPVFRPQHLRAAVEASCHVFCEKPVAVDGKGVRSVLKTAALAKERGLSLASGFCWRAAFGHRAIYQRILQGAIGDVVGVHATYMAGQLWYKERQADWSDLQYQLRNWVYYSQLSGDHIVEQAIHSVDKIMWAKNDETPASVMATGGRQTRTQEKYGNVFDHFSAVYDWADGTQAALQCRQMKGCHMENLDRVIGSSGIAYIDGWAGKFEIKGQNQWKYDGPSNDMYQTEHDDLFESIRNGDAMNQGVDMAHSTLAAIMIRMSAYTGQVVSWEQALNSQLDLTPEKWDGGAGLDSSVAHPGKTKLI
ncbi:MAG: Gfo/Idh/MocA family oxidoreductase [Planctomycetes bacterium]|nr:Gfo/Idh/MocA family oxidoreductase [Planctomycetota bacterium]